MISKAEIVGSLRPTYMLANSTLNTYLSKASKRGAISRVRRGVYISPDIHDRFVIGCEAVPAGFIAYHSALEYYGLVEEEYPTTQVASVNRFRSFEYNLHSFERVPSTTRVGIETFACEDGNVRCSSITRTLIDCIERPDLCGGQEIIWNAFLRLKKKEVDFVQASELLTSKSNKSLYQRVGYYFSIFSKQAGTPKTFLKECLHKSGDVVSGIVCVGPTVYDSKWRLEVPKEVNDDKGKQVVRYITPEQRKSVLFMSGIIENYKSQHGLTAKQTLDLFETKDIISWLENNWEILHTVSVDYVIEQIDGLLEEKK